MHSVPFYITVLTDHREHLRKGGKTLQHAVSQACQAKSETMLVAIVQVSSSVRNGHLFDVSFVVGAKINCLAAPWGAP